MATFRPAQCSAMSTLAGGNPESISTLGTFDPGVIAAKPAAVEANVASKKLANFMVFLQ